MISKLNKPKRIAALRSAIAEAALAAAVLHPLLGQAAPAPAEAPDRVRVVLKFVKAQAASSTIAFDPDSCTACRPLHDAEYDRDNVRETLIALELPARRTMELRFRAPAGTVRRVLLETGDLKFQTEGDVVTVQLPPTGYDAVIAGELATHIVEPGMVLRFEHADPERRAGAYANGEFPLLQRRAANNLEFAQREVIRRTGLGDYVAREKIGTIEVMGFDTNDPHGHTDAPPHMHMHLRWPNNAGTQIGHYYIDTAGLLARNEVGTKDIGVAGQTFGRGSAFTTRDMYGRPVYTHKITAAGWLELGRANEAPCLILPVGKGFDSGAAVECPNQKRVVVNVMDDLGAGLILIATDSIQEVFRYDPDTGKLLSDSGPPPVSESSYQPPEY